jgi:uncharacterized protein YidB (DUF937 family)
MGLLDSVMGSFGAGGGQPAKKPGLGSTVAAGAVLALLIKGVHSYQRSHPEGGPETRSFDPGGANAGAAPAPASGGLGGILGRLTGGGSGSGGGGLGGLLGGLGGAGALGALVSQFRQKGLGPQVDSWVGDGPNAPVAPDQLAQALGEDNLRQLEQQTGLSREPLLQELSQHLPQAIHDVTPQGRLPNDQELHDIAARAAQGRG